MICVVFYKQDMLFNFPFSYLKEIYILQYEWHLLDIMMTKRVYIKD